MQSESEKVGVVSIPHDEIWTTEEAAQYLKVCENTVRTEAKRGKIPGAFQVGSLWWFSSQKIRQLAA